jgi:hypothetical protein
MVPAVYSAGYRAGQRLAALPLRNFPNSTRHVDNPWLIGLGANDYADGFAAGHAGAVPTVEPLLLSDVDNERMGAR